MLRYWVVGLSVAGVMAVSGGASAETSLTPDYLEGRWTSGAAEDCGKAGQETTVFRKDGTFVTEHGGTALAVGFWSSEFDKLTMDILTKETSLPTALAEALPGDIHALHLSGLAFDQTDQGFRLVQSIGDELRGLDMVRCPAS